jgi:glycosyltransferase involved in cell wall biosynthesis
MIAKLMAEKICGGKRVLKKQLPFDENIPSISVITVTYNRLDGLRKTFSSIASQTYANIEYIVIDGGSEDGTVNFLQENNDLISFWISERDAGIYDAMNKGASVATGDWVIFMNSGDKFFCEDTLNQVSAHLDNSVDVVYGGVESILVDSFQTRILQRKPRSLSEIWRQIPTCHQSIFVKLKLQVQFPFDTSLIWCADHDLLVKLYATGYSFKEIPYIISKFDATEGNRDILIYTRERWRISKRVMNPLKRHTYFLREYIGFFIYKHITTEIRNILPKQLVLTLRKFRGTG